MGLAFGSAFLCYWLARRNEKKKMKRQYIYISLVAGAFLLRLLAEFSASGILLVLPGDHSQCCWFLFPEPRGAFLFGFGLLLIFPFAILVIMMWWISGSYKGRPAARLYLLDWAYRKCGDSQYEALGNVWHAIYMQDAPHDGLPFAVTFLFIPSYALVPLAIGLLIGWGVSFLPLFQEGKRKAN